MHRSNSSGSAIAEALILATPLGVNPGGGVLSNVAKSRGQMAHVTRGEGLTPQDVLVLGWLAQKQGMSSANIGACIGRPRQSVQRALERYEAHGLTERFPSYIRKRTEGWGLTEKGLSLWGRIECGFAEQEREFARRGLDVRRLVFDLEELMVGLMAATRHMSRVGLIETPLVHEEPQMGITEQPVRLYQS